MVYRIAFIFCLMVPLAMAQEIETERTLWRPWTIEDTYQWDEFENLDQERLFFRRNDYFEKVEVLEQREKNWLELHALLKETVGASTPFPPLGYAILRKCDHQLIGSIVWRFATSNPNYMQFGYGFRPDVRSQKYGKEIMTRLLHLTQERRGTPMVHFKDDASMDQFNQEWKVQGKWRHPDWPTLLSAFSREILPFQGLEAEVDMDNPASLAVAYHQGMIPVESLYEETHLGNDTLYSLDFLFLYPCLLKERNSQKETWVKDLLSRNPQRIEKAHREIATHHHFPPHGIYKNYNRTTRQAMEVLTFYLNSAQTLRITVS